MNVLLENGNQTLKVSTFGELLKNQSVLQRLPVLEDTMNYTLKELLGVLANIGGFGAIQEFFKMHNYRVLQPYKGTKWEEKVFGIKYIDGKNNLWRPTWARECRGRFYYMDGERNAQMVISVLKDSLERGAEVLTHNHIIGDIKETQDMSADSISHFQDVQQDCIKAFAADNAPINAYITGKADGSLIVVNVYARGSIQEQVMTNIIEECGDLFSKVLLEYCKKRNYPLITVSSQGTLLLGEDMQDYFVTSLRDIIDYGYSSSEKERTRSEYKKLVSDVWEMICPKFSRRVMEFIDEPYSDYRFHICFEAICRNRITITNIVHPEMAVNYNHDRFILLGTFVCEPDKTESRYIPHFKQEQHIFREPIWLPVKETKEVFDIMNGMDEFVLGKMKKHEFIEKYFSSSSYFSVLHMEGWVLLTECADGRFDYSKIKTNMYYKCHKIREDNMEWLLALPSSCGDTYPVLNALHKCFDNFDDNVRVTMREYCDAIKSQISVESIFYKQLGIKAQARVSEYIEGGCSDEDALDIIIKMFVNVCKDNINELIKPINVELWGNDNIGTIMKQIFIKSMCWKSDAVLNEMLANKKSDKMMQELYTTLVYKMSPP